MSEPLRADDPLESVGFDRAAKLEAYRRRRAGLVAVEKLATLIGPTDQRELKGCPLAVLDVETTGLDHATGYITEVAVVHHAIGSDADPVVAFASYVRPPLPIPAESTKITGIDDNTVKDAPMFRDVVDRIVEACDGRLVVGHNAPFDFQFLREEFRRAQRTPLSWPWLDTFVLRKALKTRGRPGKLTEIASDYGIMLDPHGAAGDATVTALLVTPMLRDLYRLISTASQTWDDDDDYDQEENLIPAARVELNVGRLLGWQRDAALDQEREFTAYAQRSAWRERPSCGWHVVEGRELPPFRGPVAPASKCSTCKAAITWAVTRAGAKMPLDYEPIEIVIVSDPDVATEIVGRHLVPEGEAPTVRLASGYTDAVEHVTGYIVPAELRPDLARTPIRLSHFASCPDSKQHRKPSEPPR